MFDLIAQVYYLPCFFFFNDTATTEIYTLSLHDALPISSTPTIWYVSSSPFQCRMRTRSEEHTSELQSPCNLVCRLLLEKKKQKYKIKKERNKVVEDIEEAENGKEK